MSNLVFVFAAYTIVWLILVVYVLVLARRQTGLSGEIEELEQATRRVEEIAEAAVQGFTEGFEEGLATVDCSNCGAGVQPDWSFCNGCGHSISPEGTSTPRRAGTD